MALRCKCLCDEYIGTDSAAVCRRGIAKQMKIECPKVRFKWTVSPACFNLSRIGARYDSIKEPLMDQTETMSGDGRITE